MTDIYEPRRKKNLRVRERQQARRTGGSFFSRYNESDQPIPIQNKSDQQSSRIPGPVLFAGDVFLDFFRGKPIARIVFIAVLSAVVLFSIWFLTSGRIMPNIYTMGVNLGGMTPEEAQRALIDAWFDDARIGVVADGDQILSATPAELGISIDTDATVQKAKDAGFAGIPFGISLDPEYDVDLARTQGYLLDIVDDVFLPPFEAGFEWENGTIKGIPGRSSRELDVTLTTQRFEQDAARILERGSFELVTYSTPPSIVDPSPYLDEVSWFVSQDFQLTGYDPFTDEHLPWTTTPEEVTSWLAAGEDGLEVRVDAFTDFVNALNATLDDSNEKPRYIDEREALDQLQVAIAGGERSAYLRVRYRPTVYEVTFGDTGHGIGRVKGLPFGLIQDVNPSTNWNALTKGDIIQIPSRDKLLPNPVVPNKRIVVDLDRFWMVAYEDGQMVFSWEVSTGRPSAPSLPGIYQILMKDPIAYGSSYSLCNDAGTNCAQWEMHSFMGIYEVTPGLVNGFHGAVVLPNGAYLGGGDTGFRSTFGCVMAEDGMAKALFDWAEVGTVVEIYSTSDGFYPESALGQQAMQYIRGSTL